MVLRCRKKFDFIALSVAGNTLSDFLGRFCSARYKIEPIDAQFMNLFFKEKCVSKFCPLLT
jgi:hypothetical protein